MQTEFLQLFQQHLLQLKKEIEAYRDEKHIWALAEGIVNSGGTLCYHLLGNLNHFIGRELGHSGYVRNRPLEFSIRDVPKASLVEWIEETSAMIAAVLPGVDLKAVRQFEYWEESMTAQQALLKLLGHLNYHLGQVNYHRRLVGR